jgi:flagellar basal-body rod protein FlgB
MLPDRWMNEPLLRQMERVLDVMSHRQRLVASNIANVDTPGFKTVDLDFDRALVRALEEAGEEKTTSPAGREVEGLPVRNDGNNVSLEREMLALREIRGKYRVATTVVRKRLSQLNAAIREGR